MSSRSDVFLVRDFERICRGETSLETSGPVLHLPEQIECVYLAFEHGRVCVATVRISNSALARELISFLPFFFSPSIFSLLDSS
jgi:hypothetical protein